MKEDLFQIIANELSNRLFWGLGVVPKTDDEIYVSISIGKYKSTVFCIVSKKVMLLKISKVR